MKKRKLNQKLKLTRESIRRVASGCPPEFDLPQSWTQHGEACCCVIRGGGQVSFH